MLLRPRGAVAAAEGVVNEVLDELQAAWQREAERGGDGELPGIGEWSVVAVADGVRVLVIEPEAFPSTLEDLVAGLEERGVQGRIGLYSPPRAKAPGHYVDLLVCRMRIVGRRVEHESGSYRWIADPEVHRSVLEAAVRWCRRAGPDATYALQAGMVGPFAVAADEEVTDRLAGRTISVFTAMDEQRWRGVHVPPWADVVALGVGCAALSDEEVRDAVTDLTAILRDLASSLVYGAIRRGWDFLSDPGAAVGLDWPNRPRPSPLGPKFTREAFEDEFAPDAFGVQLLGAGYSNRAIADDEWVVENLDADRRLVSHRDPTAWFDDPFVPLFDWRTPNADHPTPDVLNRARRQLEALLYTPGVLAASGYTGVKE